MGTYEEEFKQRLRRVCGVEDDTTEVSYETASEEAYGGCDTCGYGGSDGRAYVEVTVKGGESGAYEYREFSDLGELLRAMEGVKL